MNRKIFSFFVAVVVSIFMSANIFAQSERNASAVSQLYVISAKAGGVNFIQGKVAVARNNSRSGYLLKGDQLEIGEKVSTGTEGRAEILLNPGSFVRLGENTEFQFVSTSLDNLKMKLTRGSAVFELIADSEFEVAIETPKGSFKAVESGIYRVDVNENGTGELFVFGGKAKVADSNATVVKKGRTVTFNGEAAVAAKFDRDDRDELDVWSKARAKELSKINAKLQRNDFRNSLVNSFNRRGGWGFNDSFGLWVFDRFSGQYCFLPFGYGWGSPYGYYYDRDLYYFRLPRYVYYYPTVRNPGGSSNPGTNPGSNPNTDGGIRNGRSNQPPFTRVNPGAVRQPISVGDDSSPIRRPMGRPMSVPMGVPASIPVDTTRTTKP